MQYNLTKRVKLGLETDVDFVFLTQTQLTKDDARQLPGVSHADRQYINMFHADFI